jgi:hypothetical protein
MAARKAKRQGAWAGRAEDHPGKLVQAGTGVDAGAGSLHRGSPERVPLAWGSVVSIREAQLRGGRVV